MVLELLFLLLSEAMAVAVWDVHIFTTNAPTSSELFIVLRTSTHLCAVKVVTDVYTMNQ